MHLVHAITSSEQDVSLATQIVTRSAGRITAPVFVDTQWLQLHHNNIVVIDTRPHEDFMRAHLLGAVSLPLNSLLIDDSSSTVITRLAEATKSALAARGVMPDDHVVLMDECDGSAALGGLICELAGMRNVSVLYGHGLDSNMALSYEKESTASRFKETINSRSWDSVTARTTSIASFEDLVESVMHTNTIILDVRSQLEHEGIVGTPCCENRGAIPGSINIEWTTFFDVFGMPRSALKIKELMKQVGIDCEDSVLVTCHNGHRAAIAARVLRFAGFRNIRVSLGSWHEWSNKKHS